MFAIVAYRATTHVNTAILVLLPFVGIVYANLLETSELPSQNFVLLLEGIPYLNDQTEFGPRWTSMFMVAQMAFSFYAIRSEDRPMGETRWEQEQLLTIGIAGTLAFAYIIPDFRVAWIFIAIAITGYCWRVELYNGSTSHQSRLFGDSATFSIGWTQEVPHIPRLG